MPETAGWGSASRQPQRLSSASSRPSPPLCSPSLSLLLRSKVFTPREEREATKKQREREDQRPRRDHHIKHDILKKIYNCNNNNVKLDVMGGRE